MTDQTNPPNGPERYQFELRFPGGYDSAAFLTAWLDKKLRVTVELAPRQARLPLALWQARCDDETAKVNGPTGWRSRSDLATMIEQMTGYPPSEYALSAYAVQLLKKLSAAVEAVSPDARLPFLERRRKLGFRLAENVDLRVIRGPRPPNGSPPNSSLP